MATRGTNAPAPSPRAGVLPYLLMAGLGLSAAACAKASVGDDGTKRDAGAGDAEPKTDSGPSDLSGGKDGPAPEVSYGVCNPFTNSGCDGGQKCTALQQSDGTLALGCDSKGPKSAGDTCTRETSTGAVSADDCDGGLACFSTGASATCHRICPTSGTANACPSGEACTLVVAGLTGLAFCQATTSCLPLEQTGCPSGQDCYVDQTGAICAPTGSSQPGETCTHANDCAKGSTCLMVGSAGTCSSFCSTASGGTPSCTGSATGGTICEPIGGEPNLGNCRVQP